MRYGMVVWKWFAWVPQGMGRREACQYVLRGLPTTNRLLPERCTKRYPYHHTWKDRYDAGVNERVRGTIQVPHDSAEVCEERIVIAYISRRFFICPRWKARAGRKLFDATMTRKEREPARLWLCLSTPCCVQSPLQKPQIGSTNP